MRTDSPLPKGTQAELLTIVRSLDPDVAEEAAKGFAAHMDAIAIYFLSQRADAEDRRTARDEHERYKRIQAAAKELRLALDEVATPGVLLGPLAKERQFVGANVDVAYSICLRWPKAKTHPLSLVEAFARKAMEEIDTKPGAASLHIRRHGEPQSVLATCCARLYWKILRQKPAISASGQLFQLTAQLWKYATGLDVPDTLGYHAKKAAWALRAAPDERQIK